MISRTEFHNIYQTIRGLSGEESETSEHRLMRGEVDMRMRVRGTQRDKEDIAKKVREIEKEKKKTYSRRSTEI